LKGIGSAEQPYNYATDWDGTTTGVVHTSSPGQRVSSIVPQSSSVAALTPPEAPPLVTAAEDRTDHQRLQTLGLDHLLALCLVLALTSPLCRPFSLDRHRLSFLILFFSVIVVVSHRPGDGGDHEVLRSKAEALAEVHPMLCPPLFYHYIIAVVPLWSLCVDSGRRVALFTPFVSALGCLGATGWRDRTFLGVSTFSRVLFELLCRLKEKKPPPGMDYELMESIKKKLLFDFQERFEFSRLHLHDQDNVLIGLFSMKSGQEECSNFLLLQTLWLKNFPQTPR
jgi:hypothetical protein